MPNDRKTARYRINRMIPKPAKQYGVTGQLKAEKRMEWVRQINTCRALIGSRQQGKIKMDLMFGKESDIDGWMRLVYSVKENFPGLETNEALNRHKNSVLDFMSKESAICAKIDGKIVGILLFSKEDSMICFLAVDSEYRRQHIAEKMVSYMLRFLNAKKDVVVTTYRKGVPEGIAARAFYKRFGFMEGKLTEEFGSPVQEFILTRQL